jgi:hypothetical protein
MGHKPSCPDCTAKVLRAHKDRVNAYRRGHPEYLARSKDTNLRRYGLTVEQWQAMVDAQGNLCAICNSPPTPGTGPATQRLHVDHDHRTGQNRALLCNNCNRGLGYLGDSPERLRAAADYIEDYRT